jgi:hypothetical protein
MAGAGFVITHREWREQQRTDEARAVVAGLGDESETLAQQGREALAESGAADVAATMVLRDARGDGAVGACS